MNRLYPKEVKGYLEDKLEELVEDFDESLEGKGIDELVSRLLDEDIGNGSVPCDAETARRWIAENVGCLGDWFDLQAKHGTLQNPFSEPEKFQLQVFCDCFADMIISVSEPGVQVTKEYLEELLDRIKSPSFA